ncbi:MAG TPA: alpha/beta fold hydrolase [Burkholderiaceae bacterium]|nr:alpha/beta fold hydrolase [Burkholderiaceae bacterium]
MAMLAQLLRSWVLGLLALAIAAGWWARQGGSPPWLAVGVGLVVLNVHALAMACEFAWLRGIDPGPDVPRPSLGSLCKAWSGEVITGVRVFGWRQPFRSRVFEDHLAGARGRRGILLLHGFVCNRGLWNPWMQRLREADTPFVAINLEPVFGSIDQYVAAIDDAIRRLEEATRLPPVIVAHSMGGLAARAWLRQPGARDRAHSVVTIGTPHAGTWLARFAVTENGRQMRESNDWLRELQDGETASARALFTCYFGHCDNIVFPARNAMLDGATNLHVPGVAHVDLAFHEPILDDVLSRTRA